MPKICEAPAALLRSPHALPRIVTRLQRGDPVKIVAIGSSSTYGTGASSPQANFPNRLQAALRGIFPRAAVTVVNRGIPGDTSSGMIERFRRDAVDPLPDLIIWQTGTNSALGHGDLERFADDIARGIKMARAARIEIMLIGPQYAPRFESVQDRMDYIEHLKAVASVKDVPFFPRYEIMKHWIESGQFTLATMIDADGLHLTDQSYACTSWLVARMIAGTPIEAAQHSR